MAIPLIKTAFTSGELSPSLFGHVDLARFSIGAATMRNFIVSYRGGAYSRAGTKFVGFSKQTGRSYPPRMVPFQFKINQGLALEFGHQYMRVISNGAFVVDGTLPITAISQASPAVVTTAAAVAASAATSITAGAIATYAPGDTVTLAGGTFTAPAVLQVTSTTLLAVQVLAPGATYVPGNTITLAGGTFSAAAVATVTTTQVASATIAAAGSGGTNGTAVVTGTTGTGTKFKAHVTIAGGVITSVDSISGGSYTVNPTVPATEPVTGAGLTGAQLNVVMGVNVLAVTTPGLYTVNPPLGQFTQASTSGSGTGATFQFALMAPSAVTVATPGVYTAFPANPVSQASTSGSGLGAKFTVTTTPVAGFSNGDWVAIAGVAGMTQVNGGTYVIHGVTTTTFQLYDVYGTPIDSTAFGAYASGGTASSIYTLTTPYAEQDLQWLKFTQSADVMSLCCVNQDTLTEYAPQDLIRNTNTDWTFGAVVPKPTVLPPSSTSLSVSPPDYSFHVDPDNGYNTDYAYVVTAVNPDDATESIASPIARAFNQADISAASGTVTVSWTAVAGVNEYNVYKATPAHRSRVQDGVPFGFAGFAYGTSFLDSNVVSDFSQTPPLHHNPFARGQVISATPVSGGSGYTTATATVNTSTGSGAVLQVVLQATSGTAITPTSVSAIIIQDPGEGYLPGDTISISGDGAGATASLKVGPETGTYPSVPTYFQQRRVYANSLNNPDTYWMSQPGAYTNFDTRIPTIASDAVTGTPWSVQVNGIQFMLSMPGGLVALTGLAAWQLTGAGGSSLNPQPITPSTQQAQPQAYNGCSATVPPIKIDYDIIFVQAKGSVYRSFSYQFFTNIYTGIDLTLNSSQLFTGYTIREHAWCEEPFKILWSVRDDGSMLSLTYVKPQEVAGWSRHDTNGEFVSSCNVTEPPVDALYLATRRYPGANTAYMIERMDDRIWTSSEDCWCVDSGLRLGQPAPAAILSASSAPGLGGVDSAAVIAGGTGYSAATTATIVDDNGEGSGTGAAVAALTISAGVITGVVISPHGSGYTYPRLDIFDPSGAGSGASVILTLNNITSFTASAPVFSLGNVGDVIRMGGGIATITDFTDATHVVAQITSPITAIRPNSGGKAQQQAAGTWTMTTPVSTIGGLEHLAGATVTGVADGQVITPRVVSPSGSIALDAPASAVTVGLGYQAQLQSVYLDAGDPTVQGQRKKIAAVTARVESSAGFEIGANQVDGSTMNPPQIAPLWTNMAAAPDLGVAPYGSLVTPLYTGDVRIPVGGGYEKPGQVAVQQSLPLPLQILSFIPELLPGDEPETKAPQQQRRQAAQ